MQAAKGRKYVCALFKLQYWQHRDEAFETHPRFGLTVTKKIGNAVERNRIKRRLRAAIARATQIPSSPHVTSSFQERCDYVIIANRALLTVNFETLVDNLITAATYVHKMPNAKSNSRPQNPALRSLI